MFQQRSKEWFEERGGNFTASQISRLLGKESLKKTKDAIDNYCLEKAIEKIHGIQEDAIISYDMQRGIDLEPMAFSLFKQLKSYEFIDVTETGFHKYYKNDYEKKLNIFNAGASPDGLTSDNSNLEIKCPRRNKFFKLVANGIEEVDSSYMAQMQMQMLCTDTEKTYFFNYFIENSIQHCHQIIIHRDDDMIDLIKERIEKAVLIRDNYVKKIQENTQY